MLTLECNGMDRLTLISLEQAVELLSEPQQTLQEFILKHPMLSYYRLGARTYRFLAREVVDLANKRKNEPDNKDILFPGPDSNSAPTPDNLLTYLNQKNIYVEEKRPQAYVCFISDGTYVKVAAVKDVTKCLDTVKVAFASQLELLFVIPICLFDNEPFIRPNYDYDRKCAKEATEVIEQFFLPYHVKNGWYDILSLFNVDDYKECFDLKYFIGKNLEKVGTGVPADLQGKFAGFFDSLTPNLLDNILLDYTIPPVEDDIEFYVYFVSDGRFVRVGYAENVDTRIKALRRFTYKDLTVLFTIPIGYAERAVGDTVLVAKNIIHEIISDYHVNGEWYDILDKINVSSFQQHYGSLCLPGEESAQEYKNIVSNRNKQ